MLLYLYQIFSSLRSHLHFFVHFFFTFMEYFFLWTPYIISSLLPSFSHATSHCYEVCVYPRNHVIYHVGPAIVNYRLSSFFSNVHQ